MNHLTGATKILGIIGDPIIHSLSPVIQNAAIAACDLDYIYVPFLVRPESLSVAVSGLRALGVCGFNVTVPHKTAVIDYLDELDESAVSAGAVNTVLVKDGLMIGFNTDGSGFISSLFDDLGYRVGSGSIVVIGAGGAARGAVAALCRAGAEKIIIANRSLDKATELVEEMHSRYPQPCLEVSLLDRVSSDHFSSASLLVNTTTIGMKNDRLESICLSLLPVGAKVYDMVYSPPRTPLLLDSSSVGIMCVNGMGMLAAQGELSFTIWTGKTPPKGLMKQVLTSVCGF